MTYTPSYDRPQRGKYAAERSFSQVLAGTDAYLLEDEVNEMQAILREQTRDAVRQLLSSGVLRSLTIAKDAARADVLRIAPFEAVLDGVKVKVAGINTTGTAREEEDGEDNLILLGAAPEAARTDALLLEVSEAEVRGDQTLYRYGAVGSDFTMENDLFDGRIGEETSRRLQVQSAIRVVQGVDPDAAAIDTGAGVFTEVAPGLLQADDGRLAIRQCVVNRSATDTELPTPVAKHPLARLQADQIADGSLPLAKLSASAVSDLQDRLGLGVTSDVNSDGGFIPLLRFGRWWSHSSPNPAPVGTPYRYASVWGNNLVQKSGAAWQFFTEVNYMSQTIGAWYDPNIQLSSYNGVHHYDNVTVLCMQNVTGTDQVFRPTAILSMNGETTLDASASCAYQIFTPGDKPALDGNFVDCWEKTLSGTLYSGVSVTVPAGQVILFVLKTSPHQFANNATTFYYNNYHGLKNMFAQNGMSTSFKPHLATYRRLLTGKWD